MRVRITVKQVGFSWHAIMVGSDGKFHSSTSDLTKSAAIARAIWHVTQLGMRYYVAA